MYCNILDKEQLSSCLSLFKECWPGFDTWIPLWSIFWILERFSSPNLNKEVNKNIWHCDGNNLTIELCVRKIQSKTCRQRCWQVIFHYSSLWGTTQSQVTIPSPETHVKSLTIFVTFILCFLLDFYVSDCDLNSI